MRLILCYIFGILLIGASACQSSNSEATESETTSTTNTTTPPTTTMTAYPAIPTEIIQELYEKCDYIDYIFYDWDFSVNVNTPTNTRKNLRQLGAVPPQVLNCPNPMGRMSMLAGGEVILEGEIYFQPNVCNYFILHGKDKNVKYSAQMTQEGLNFINDLRKRAGQ